MAIGDIGGWGGHTGGGYTGWYPTGGSTGSGGYTGGGTTGSSATTSGYDPRYTPPSSDEYWYRWQQEQAAAQAAAQFAAQLAQQAALAREQMALQRWMQEQQSALSWAEYLTSMRGPKDYFQYQQALRAGETTMPSWAQAAQGKLGLKAWAAPAETLQPANDQERRDAAIQAIWEGRPDLAEFYRSQNWRGGDYTPAEAVENWLQMPDNKGKDPVAYAVSKGWLAPASSGYDASGNALPTGSPGIAPAVLPYRINAATWSQMSPSEQQVALSAAEARGWDAQDYMDIMQKSWLTGPSQTRAWWR
jgi:hypothetical protein